MNASVNEVSGPQLLNVELPRADDDDEINFNIARASTLALTNLPVGLK